MLLQKFGDGHVLHVRGERAILFYADLPIAVWADGHYWHATSLNDIEARLVDAWLTADDSQRVDRIVLNRLADGD